MNVVEVCHALADPTRLEILKFIRRFSGSPSPCDYPEEYGVCVCHIAEHIGITQPRVSYHLKTLKHAGLVQEVSRGKWSFYSLVTEKFGELVEYINSQFLTEEADA